MPPLHLVAATLLAVSVPLGSIACAQGFETADIHLRVGSYVADGKPLSCTDGEQRLRQLGFDTVEATDCGEQSYTYRVSRAGARYEVVVGGEDGRITRRTSF